MRRPARRLRTGGSRRRRHGTARRPRIERRPRGPPWPRPRSPPPLPKRSARSPLRAPRPEQLPRRGTRAADPSSCHRPRSSTRCRRAAPGPRCRPAPTAGTSTPLLRPQRRSPRPRRRAPPAPPSATRPSGSWPPAPRRPVVRLGTAEPHSRRPGHRGESRERVRSEPMGSAHTRVEQAGPAATVGVPATGAGKCGGHPSGTASDHAIRPPPERTKLRRRGESNPCARLCRPLPNHSATSPAGTPYPRRVRVRSIFRRRPRRRIRIDEMNTNCDHVRAPRCHYPVRVPVVVARSDAQHPPDPVRPGTDA